MSKKLYSKHTIAGNIYHPGTYIKDELENNEFSQKYLAEKMGIKPSVLSELINGKRNITASLAIKLEDYLGISAEMWMKLQARYEIMTIKMRMKSEIENAKIPTQKKESFIGTIV